MFEELLKIISHAFDPTGFPARWNCGTWSDTLGWLHIIGDSLIFLAYVTIPLLLAYFIRQSNGMPVYRVMTLFAAFIICCGTGHLIEAIIFWVPIYRFAGLWKMVTALVSIATVAALVPLIPKALELRKLFESNRNLKKSLKIINDLRNEQETLARDVAHFLKEPVRAINYRVTSLSENWSNDSSQGLKELKRTQEQSERLHWMVNQIVTHTNIISTSAECHNLNLEELLKALLAVHLSEESTQKLRVEENVVSTLHSDPHLIEKAVERCIQWIEDSNYHLYETQISSGTNQSEEQVLLLSFIINDLEVQIEDLTEPNQLFPQQERDINLCTAHRILRRLGGNLYWEEGTQRDQKNLVLCFTDIMAETSFEEIKKGA